MPAGAEWQGVYYSPTYGYLHLLVDGKTAQGAWRTGGGDAWGEMQGEVDGNVLQATPGRSTRSAMIGAEAQQQRPRLLRVQHPQRG